MPEDSDEKQEVKALEKCVDKKKAKVKKITIKEPRLLASFILTQEPGYVWLDGRRIKNKWPNLRMSIKRINEMMDTDEFRQAVRDQIPDCTKEKSAGMFNMLLLKYFDGQMALDIPHAKALAIFGQISGRYDPMQKMEIYDGHKLDAEKQKQVNEEVVNALINKFKREQKEKEGTGNGKE
jgi:hypothetical protein